MWPPGIYSGALPVTPFRTGVPRERRRNVKLQGLKERRGERHREERAMQRTREIGRVKSAGNKHLRGILCSSNWEPWRRQRDVQVEREKAQVENEAIVCVHAFVCRQDVRSMPQRSLGVKRFFFFLRNEI